MSIFFMCFTIDCRLLKNSKLRSAILLSSSAQTTKLVNRTLQIISGVRVYRFFGEYITLFGYLFTNKKGPAFLQALILFGSPRWTRTNDLVINRL